MGDKTGSVSAFIVRDLGSNVEKPPDGKVVNLSSGISSTQNERPLFPNKICRLREHLAKKECFALSKLELEVSKT